MASVVQPDLIPQPWSQNGSHATIPDTTSEFGRASWALGFPPETALPLNAGGIPPNWLDFQGVLYALSQHAIFEQAGGRYAWATDINYPAGACIIGSNGVVYQALQESGPGTSAGAKNPTSSGNSAYWGPLATPDGSTIKLTNGKLAVNLSGVADGTTIVAANNKLSVSAAGIADGTTIIDNDGKLTAVGGGGGGDAASLVDNKTTVARDGKITVDLSNAPALSLHGISPYLVKNGGGLTVDLPTGKIEADVSALADNITTVANNDKISVDLTNATTAALTNISTPLIKSGEGLSIDATTGKIVANLVPIEADLDVYVDGINGEDTIVVGRGTQSLPFATIQACVNYVTSHYVLGRNTIYIHVVPGTYDEVIDLPSFYSNCDGNFAQIQISRSGSSGNVTISGLRCYGGKWYISHIDVVASIVPSATQFSGTAVLVSGATTNLILSSCNISASFSGTSSAETTLYAVRASGGSISIPNGNSVQCTSGTADKAYIFYATSGGRITLECQQISGSATATAYATSFSSIKWNSSTVNPSGTVSGKKYIIQEGSGIVGPINGFPGSQNGTIEADTGCWYKTISA